VTEFVLSAEIADLRCKNANVHFLYFTNCRSEAKGIDCDRVKVTACVVKGLPNWSDYVCENREMLLEEERQIKMADTDEDSDTSDEDIYCVKLHH
jgi:hypothetical protein